MRSRQDLGKANVRLFCRKQHLMNIEAIAEDQVALLGHPSRLDLTPECHDYFSKMLSEHLKAATLSSKLLESEADIATHASLIDRQVYAESLQNLVEHKLLAYQQVLLAIQAVKLTKRK